jgi:hypothetical protein
VWILDKERALVNHTVGIQSGFFGVFGIFDRPLEPESAMRDLLIGRAMCRKQKKSAQIGELGK